MQTAMIQRFCYEPTETPILGLGLEITFTFNFHPPFPVANAILIWSHLKTRIGAGDNTSYVLVMDQHIGQLGLNESKSNEKLNKCSQYDFASSDTGNLGRHLETHSGEKQNKCSQSDYASARVSHLKSHLKTHSGEKTKICIQCNLTCSSAGNLRTHLKIHRGDKSNKCNQCDYASSQAAED